MTKAELIQALDVAAEGLTNNRTLFTPELLTKLEQTIVTLRTSWWTRFILTRFVGMSTAQLDDAVTQFEKLVDLERKIIIQGTDLAVAKLCLDIKSRPLILNTIAALI